MQLPVESYVGQPWRSTLLAPRYLRLSLVKGAFTKSFDRGDLHDRVAGLLCVWLMVPRASPAFAANCWAPTAGILANQTMQRTMQVVGGRRCSLVVARTLGSISGARLTVPPTTGRVSVQGGRVTYFSRPGYLGEDRFVFAREGKDRFNQPATWTIEVNVQVKERL
jgi:hypothetical protein